MKNPFVDLMNLLYPRICLVCGNALNGHEKQLCVSCVHGIPRTNYHLLQDNPVEKKFWGKVTIFRGTSFFYFQKGSPYQKVLHALKYKGNQEVGELLGKLAGVDLVETVDFNSVDVIVPVPLHPQKLKSRGYNQSEMICNGLAVILQKPVSTSNLVRLKENTTQTKKSVYERYENTDGIFGLVDKYTFQDLHVLLVDDVLTTGSTLEACISVLEEVPNIKVSVVTLAVA